MVSGFRHAFHARFDTSALRRAFAPRKPRHALARVLLGLVGLVVLAGLLVIGLVVGATMLAFGLLRKLAGGRGSGTPAHGQVIDGEYRVAPKDGTRPVLLR